MSTPSTDGEQSLRLLDELAAGATSDELEREAFASLLHAAAEDPLLLVRIRRDPLLADVTERFGVLLAELESRAAENWQRIVEAGRASLVVCEPWSTLASKDVHERYIKLQQAIASAEEQAGRGDPFGQIEAAESIEPVAHDAEELAVRARTSVTAEQRQALQQLDRVVRNANAELKAAEEWVDAATAAQECARLLEGIDELPDREARESLEQVRHQTGLQLEMLDVTWQGIQRRDRRRADERRLRQAEDRAVLAKVREFLRPIHVQLVASAFLAVFLYFLGPGVILAIAPTLFAVWRSYEGRAIVQQRVWSIPRSQVEPLSEALTTRLIISILLIVGVAIESVILWMRDNV